MVESASHTKTVRLGRKGQLVLPKDVRDALEIKEGDRLIVSVEGGRVVLASPQEYARQTRGLLHGTWGETAEEVAGYLRGERDGWESGAV